jgi:CRISPR/Cas system CSM-associated protein Csm3 (group 7 of RAMP superfamily)
MLLKLNQLLSDIRESRKIKITVTVDTGICIGDSGASGAPTDKMIFRDGAGRLVIPASTIKGRLRHECEIIARAKKYVICESPKAENMCPQLNSLSELEREQIETDDTGKHCCIICQIFGSPKSPARVIFNDLICEDEFSTEMRGGIAINRRRRAVEDAKLFRLETSKHGAGIKFSGEIELSDSIHNEHRQLIIAGLKRINTLGNRTSAGVGWLRIEYEEVGARGQEGKGARGQEGKKARGQEGKRAKGEEAKGQEGKRARGSCLATLPSCFIASLGEYQVIETSQLQLVVTLHSPLAVGGRKPAGRIVEIISYIPGGLLRGAVAKKLLELGAHDDNCDENECDFCSLFLSNEQAIFRNCYPFSGLSRLCRDDTEATNLLDNPTLVLPSTAVSCADNSGFLEYDKNGNPMVDDFNDSHGVFDTLIDRLIVEERLNENNDLPLLYAPGCPVCGGCVEPFQGFYSVVPSWEGLRVGGKYKSENISTRILSRIPINRSRKVAEEELLYHLSVLNHVTKFSPREINNISYPRTVVLPTISRGEDDALLRNNQATAQTTPLVAKPSQKESPDEACPENRDGNSIGVIRTRLIGSVTVPKRLARDLAEVLKNRIHNLGGGSARGLGRVKIDVIHEDNNPQSPTQSAAFKNRIDAFNRKIAESERRFQALGKTKAIDGTYFTIDLHSDAILYDASGWQPTTILTAEMLQKVTNCDAQVELLRSYARYTYYNGWNAAWGMLKETEVITQMGSVFVFKTNNIEAWYEPLKKLELYGVGERRGEGFGQLKICDEFHLRTRDELSDECQEMRDT